MLKIIISGSSGHMGKAVTELALNDQDITIAAGFDVNAQKLYNFPIYAEPLEFSGSANVVVDFSTPAALGGLLSFCLEKKTPLVLCTTGYSEDDLQAIHKTAETLPVFMSGNMSLGINLLADLVRRSCAALGLSFDVEIVERHHRRKVDAPSGTALLLADAAREALPYDPEYIYARQSRREARQSHEIGISAVRGGTIVGEHEVIFAGHDEVIELKHTAFSRDVFAAGALRAAKFMAEVRKPGLYDMRDVLNSAD
ncbi:MAG: 4-hydroxy-tetrahydrodipicolinate reductase [Oscillospiraceae bacterium]|nr:4-hydroxy-tetrahydrodipicolinate reductase [Oscillospiraceae bacterium]